MTSLQEVTGMEGDVITMQEIFRFKRMSTSADGTIKGEFRATGIRPQFVDELEVRGVHLPEDMFSPDRILG
jgi:pilus assembly protein CpaF